MLKRSKGRKRKKTRLKNAGGGGAAVQKRKQLPQKTRFSCLRLMKIKFPEWKRSIYLMRRKYPARAQKRRSRKPLMLMTQPLRVVIKCARKTIAQRTLRLSQRKRLVTKKSKRPSLKRRRSRAIRMQKAALWKLAMSLMSKTKMTPARRANQVCQSAMKQ